MMKGNSKGEGKSRHLLVRLSLAAILLLVALVLLLPSLLSTGGGRSLVEGIAGRRIGGSISFGRLSLGWTSSQQVEGLVIRDAEGAEVLSVESMENDRTLWGLLAGAGEDLGTTTIKGLKAEIVADASGDTNLMKALRLPGPAEKKETGFVPVLPFGSLVLDGARCVVTAPGVEAVVFDFKELKIDRPARDKPFFFNLDLETSQGGLSGGLKARGTAEDLVDSKGRFQPLEARVDLEVKAVNLPLQGIDGAFGYGGVLSGALGKNADLTILTHSAMSKADFDMALSAPNIKGRLKAVLQDGTISLSEDGEIDFTVSPLFVERVAAVRFPGSGLRMADDAPLAVSVREVKVPLFPLDLSKAVLLVTMKSGKPMRFTGLADGADLTVLTLDVSLDATDPGGKVNADMASEILLGDAPGEARISAIMSDLFDGSGGIGGERARVKIEGVLKNVPTSLFDSLAGRGGLVTELLGRTVSAHFSAGNPEEGRTAVELLVESDRFEADTAFIVGDRIELARPSRVKARLTPRFVKLALPGKADALAGPADVDINIASLSLPPPDKSGAVKFGEVSAQATATVGPAALELQNGLEIVIEGARAEIKADSLDSIKYSISAMVSTSGEVGPAFTGGKPLAVAVSGETGVEGRGKFKGLSANIEASNSVLSIATSIAVDGKAERIGMTSPLKVEWSGSAEEVGRLFPPAEGKYGPVGGIQIKAGVEPASVSPQNFSLASVVTGMEVRIPRIELARDGQVETVIEDITVKVDMNGPAGKLEGRATAQTSFPGQEGASPLKADLLLRNIAKSGEFDLSAAALSLSIESRAAPTALAGVFMEGAGEKLIALAGPRLDVHAKIGKSPLKGGTGEANVRLESERLQVEGDLSLGEAVSLRKPLSLTVTLTPESFASLREGKKERGERSFELARRAVVKGTVADFRLPSAEGKGVGGAAFTASFTSDQLALKHVSSGREVGFEKLAVEASAKSLAAGVTLSVRGGMTDSKGTPGSIETDITVKGLIGTDGQVDTAGIGLKLAARAGKIPVALVDGLLGLGGLAEPALGQSLDLKASAELKKGTGPLSLEAKATHGRLDIDGALDKGKFTLNKPIVGEVDVTEELGRKILNKIHPLFETVKTSEKPLRFEIADTGFVVPVKNFNIAGVVVPRLTVDSNRMVFRKGGTLEMLVLLARQFGGVKGLGSSDEMEVWFTPLVGEMEGGVFRYSKRLDLLIDGRLHALSWGGVTLTGGSSYDLKLGLPAESLRKILGTDRVNEGEIFTLPLQGKEGKVDTKAILAKASLDLGRVRGQHELTEKNPLLGLVAGELTKKVIGTETGPVPPPSVTPLPWVDAVEPEPVSPPSQESDARPLAPQPSSPEEPPDKPKTEDVIRDVLDLFK